ncbi:hypothetical protein GCM10027169_38050 [Gordonia jinhuaensis]|uniref:Uncharacterized protein n=1 Tax=Gordonia jinhuaensis TaxID=1517702 RepID=A0A916T072_9ACTN|nr:hypothetical protein GCM10011489_12380 [Gordonia jinhuaensis]
MVGGALGESARDRRQVRGDRVGLIRAGIGIELRAHVVGLISHPHTVTQTRPAWAIPPRTDMSDGWSPKNSGNSKFAGGQANSVRVDQQRTRGAPTSLRV